MSNLLKSTLSLKNSGYTVVSVMIALTVAVIIMAGLTNAYVGASRSTKFSNSGNTMSVRADQVSQQLSSDIARSGIYGCYNLHTQGISAASSFDGNGINGSNVPNLVNYGLQLFDGGTAAQTDSGINFGVSSFTGGSQALKIQFGQGSGVVTQPNYGVGILNGITYRTTQCYLLNVNTYDPFAPIMAAGEQLVESADTRNYALTSCSRMDIVNGVANLGVMNNLNSAQIPEISALSNPAHDNGSMLLTNLTTRYYFAATTSASGQGLYVVQYQPASGGYSAPLLLLPNVSNLQFSVQTISNNGATRWAQIAQGFNAADVSAVNFSFDYKSSESAVESANGNFQQLTTHVSNSVSLSRAW